MNTNLFVKAAWIVAGSLLVGCMNAASEPGRMENSIRQPESTAQAERVAAGEALTPYGIYFYQIDRWRNVVHIVLQG